MNYACEPEGRLSGQTAYSGKQVSVEYSDGTGTTTTRYADGSATVFVKDLGGNITRAAGPTGTITYGYDAGGKLIHQSDEQAGEETTYAYDGAGRRIGMASGNRNVTYSYGKNGELTAAEDAIQRLSVKYTYDVMGRETQRRYGNGVRQETAYDQIGRPVMIREYAPVLQPAEFEQSRFVIAN